MMATLSISTSLIREGTLKQVHEASYGERKLAAQTAKSKGKIPLLWKEIKKLRKIAEQTGKSPYLAFEAHLPGVAIPNYTYLFPRATRDIDRRCRNRDEQLMPSTQCIEIAKGLLEGLKELHEHHIVHGDIKPENVLLFEDVPGEALCQITDFGQARSFSSSEETGWYLGDVRYRAPEGVVHEKGDIYSAGIILANVLRATIMGDHKALEDQLIQCKAVENARYPGPLKLLNFIADFIRWILFRSQNKILENPATREAATQKFIQEIEEKLNTRELYETPEDLETLRNLLTEVKKMLHTEAAARPTAAESLTILPT